MSSLTPVQALAVKTTTVNNFIERGNVLPQILLAYSIELQQAILVAKKEKELIGNDSYRNALKAHRAAIEYLNRKNAEIKKYNNQNRALGFSVLPGAAIGSGVLFFGFPIAGAIIGAIGLVLSAKGALSEKIEFIDLSALNQNISKDA